MSHWIRSKNLPYSIEEIRRMTSSCDVCNRVKPRFAKFEGTLIKATQPFERLSVDFKGPLPSVTRNKYLLTIVDEYSRFPFAFPCENMTSSTIISCLKQIFSIFGTPGYIHSDRGTSFMSRELKEYLEGLGVATSRTTAYNPQGNGQCERYNGIIWQTTMLALQSRGLREAHWEAVLDDALYSIRSLLCTATNCTPHERMFAFQRKSPNGVSLPTWLLTSERVYLRRHDRRSKFDPLVEEVELIEANPSYAHIRHPDGREDTVSIRHLAPTGQKTPDLHLNPADRRPPDQPATLQEEVIPPSPPSDRHEPPDQTMEAQPAEEDGGGDSREQVVRRTSRVCQRPKYLDDYLTSILRREE